jgi:hypothetical protein
MKLAFTVAEAPQFQALVAALLNAPIKLNLVEIRTHAKLVSTLLSVGIVDDEEDTIDLVEDFEMLLGEADVQLCGKCLIAMQWPPYASRTVDKLLTKLNLEVVDGPVSKPTH